jgi:hypothetical protein
VALDDDDRLQVVPYGGIPENEGIRIYAIKIASDSVAHAIGFSKAKQQWQQLTSVDADDLAAADSQLDTVLDEWVQDNYGTRFDVLKTA